MPRFLITLSLLFICFISKAQNIGSNGNDYSIIIETYSRDKFIEIASNKYTNSSKWINELEEYHNRFSSVLSNLAGSCPISSIIVAEDSVELYSIKDFPYLLKTEYRITKEATAVNKDGEPLGWTVSRYFVLVSRKNDMKISEFNGSTKKKTWNKLLKPLSGKQ